VAQPVQKADIAVIIPCYNEQATIADLVLAFRAALPQAQIYVFDNNSSDLTCQEARRVAPSSATPHARARAMWCVRCFQTSTPTSM